MKFENVLLMETSLSKVKQEMAQHAVFKHDLSAINSVTEWYNNLPLIKRREYKPYYEYWINYLKKQEAKSSQSARNIAKRILDTDKIGCRIKKIPRTKFLNIDAAGYTNQSDLSISVPEDKIETPTGSEKQTILHEIGHVVYFTKRLIMSHTKSLYEFNRSPNKEFVENSLGMRQVEGIADAYGYDKLPRKESFDLVSKHKSDLLQINRSYINDSYTKKLYTYINKLKNKEDINYDALIRDLKKELEYENIDGALYVNSDPKDYDYGAMDRSTTLAKIHDVLKKEAITSLDKRISEYSKDPEKASKVNALKTQRKSLVLLFNSDKYKKLKDIERVKKLDEISWRK